MIPNSNLLREALLEVLRENSKGLHSRDIDRLAAEKLKVSKEDLEILRSGTRSEFAYRMAWERTHAKAKNLILKEGNGMWRISDLGIQQRS